MKNRRGFLLAATAALVAAAVITLPVLAEEPFGVISHVDLKSKKVTLLTEQGATFEIEITDTTAIVAGTGEKLSLEAVDKSVAKAIENGRKGTFAKVKHEKLVASKVTVGIAQEKKEKTEKSKK
jgi:hypothetical protein